MSGKNLNLNKNLLGGGIQKVRTHKGGSIQIRAIEYKEEGGV